MSKYKGVYAHMAAWSAKVIVNNRIRNSLPHELRQKNSFHISNFDTEDQAAHAYDCAIYAILLEQADFNIPTLMTPNIKQWLLSLGQNASERLTEFRASLGKWSSKRGKSGFIGVRKQRSRFRASMSVNGATVNLGFFDTAEEAAKRYDQAVLKRDGKRANTNFPISKYAQLLASLSIQLPEGQHQDSELRPSSLAFSRCAPTLVSRENVGTTAHTILEEINGTSSTVSFEEYAAMHLPDLSREEQLAKMEELLGINFSSLREEEIIKELESLSLFGEMEMSYDFTSPETLNEQIEAGWERLPEAITKLTELSIQQPDGARPLPELEPVPLPVHLQPLPQDWQPNPTSAAHGGDIWRHEVHLHKEYAQLGRMCRTHFPRKEYFLLPDGTLDESAARRAVEYGYEVLPAVLERLTPSMRCEVEAQFLELAQNVNFNQSEVDSVPKDSTNAREAFVDMWVREQAPPPDEDVSIAQFHERQETIIMEMEDDLAKRGASFEQSTTAFQYELWCHSWNVKVYEAILGSDDSWLQQTLGEDWRAICDSLLSSHGKNEPLGPHRAPPGIDDPLNGYRALTPRNEWGKTWDDFCTMIFNSVHDGAIFKELMNRASAFHGAPHDLREGFSPQLKCIPSECLEEDDFEFLAGTHGHILM